MLVLCRWFDAAQRFSVQGDGNIRYYEVLHEPPYIRNLSQYQSPAPQRDLGSICSQTALSSCDYYAKTLHYITLHFFNVH